MAFINIEPWVRSTETDNWDKTLTLVGILITLFILISTIFVGGTITDVFRQQTYTLFLLIILIFGYSSMGSVPSIYGGFGKRTNMFSGILFGTIVGLIIIGISVATLAVPGLSIISSMQTLSLFYSITVVPFAEEKLFGQTVPFIIKRSLKNTWITIGLTCLVFGVFHYFAYGQNATSDVALYATIGFAMVFRFLALLGNEKLQTASFGISLHYFNNLNQIVKNAKSLGLI